MVRNGDEKWINLDNLVVDNIEKDPAMAVEQVLLILDKTANAIGGAVKDMIGLGGKKGKGQILLSIELLSVNILLLPADSVVMHQIKSFFRRTKGRHQFSIFHPCEALRRIFGDKLCVKLGCFCCWLCCIAFLIFITQIWYLLLLPI